MYAPITQDRPMPPVTPADHVRGLGGKISLVQYGDYQCPATRETANLVAKLEKQWAGRIRHVYRHFPQDALHPLAWLAAEAAEAAGAQDKFWEMHALLLDRQGQWSEEDFTSYAQELRIDAHRMAMDLSLSRHAGVVYSHYDGGRDAGVSRTPALFINGRLHEGPMNFVSLNSAIEREWFGQRPAPVAGPTRTATFRASPALIRAIQESVG